MVVCMHAHALRWMVLTLVAATALVGGLVGGATAQASDHGIALPAPAETVWSITAGYNTGTHFGSDPYAIDLVRVDGPTTGTPVLAPITGVVSWRSPSCLTLLDGLGHETLICHLFVADTVTVGDTVRPGDLLGTVAAPGFAENNGLAHIHLAVHRTIGDGQILETLPFAGAYALEGVDLTATTAANAYRGQLFTSSNGAPNTAMEVPPTSARRRGGSARRRQLHGHPGARLEPDRLAPDLAARRARPQLAHGASAASSGSMPPPNRSSPGHPACHPPSTHSPSSPTRPPSSSSSTAPGPPSSICPRL